MLRSPRAAASALLLAALSCSGNRVEELRALLRSGDKASCAAAAREVAKLGKLGVAVEPAVADLLGLVRPPPSADDCSTAAEATLVELGPRIVPALVEALAGPHANAARVVLARTPSAVEPLIARVRAGGPDVEMAVITLSALATHAVSALPALREAHAAGRIGDLRFVTALTWIGTPAAVPDLLASLKSPEEKVRDTAVQALPAAEPLTAATAEALAAVAAGDASATVRSRALGVLTEAPAHAALTRTALLRALKDADQGVRLFAGLSLADLAGRDPEVAAALRSAVREERLPASAAPVR